jgi:hypothetical protein
MSDETQDQSNQPSDTTQVTDPADNQPPNPTPAPTPPSPGVDPSILQAYTEQLLTESRKRAQLERELEALRNQPAPITPDDEKKFFDQPVSVTRQLIQEEISRAVAPLNQYTAQQQRLAMIEMAKQQMRNNPAQFPYITQVESLFDQIIAHIPNLDVNAFVNAYNTALGTFISQGGQLTTGSPAPTPTPNRSPVPTPPPVRSAPPPPPIHKKTLRQLTENEKKIARHNYMTDEEFIAWTDGVDPREVAHISNDEVIKRVK